MLRQLASACLVLFAWIPAANAQSADAVTAIRLQPFPPASWNPKSEVEITTVHNYYGRCGKAVVQVLGVSDDDVDFFTVDGGSEGTAIVVIPEGGQRPLVVKDALSDHNGVACLAEGNKPYLLIWSNCAGSGCGDDFNFTVIDVEALRAVSGAAGECDARCAQRITGSHLPLELNRRR